MTMNPKAKKFRIRRSGALSMSQQAHANDADDVGVEEAEGAPLRPAAAQTKSNPPSQMTGNIGQMGPAAIGDNTVASVLGDPQPINQTRPSHAGLDADAPIPKPAPDALPDDWGPRARKNPGGAGAKSAFGAGVKNASGAGAIDRKAPSSDAGLFDNDAGMDGFGDAPFPGSAAASKPRTTGKTGDITGADEMAIDEALDEIRREGLTGRQLRLARRVAQKHNMPATSDFDAVRLLRLAGIDPFQRATMLELVVPAEDANLPAKTEPQNKLPQTVAKAKVPSTEVNDGFPDKPNIPMSREAEIRRIQKDIARRRRRNSMLLLTRLAFFVGLPTLFVGWYFYMVATPMYATKSEFVIQQAQAAGMAAAGSGLFSGTSFATSQDSIAVQSYLTSRDAYLRLDRDIGFRNHFAAPHIDAIQRLSPDATNEEAYKLFARNVTIGYDPTEGIIKMEVVAADPEVSRAYSRALINYAEERIDQLTQRLREDQMQGARESFEDAETKMLAAQNRVLQLQEQLGVLDPVSESGALMSQITAFETQIQEKRLQLQQLQDNENPNQARVEGVKGDLKRLEGVVADLRSNLTSGPSNTSGTSLARVTSELRIAEIDLQTRQMMMQQSLQALETARIEANRQVRYLSEGVSPVAPDEATYPRAFENTILSFLIFAGIYLMASLTGSVLKEQITS